MLKEPLWSSRNIIGWQVIAIQSLNLLIFSKKIFKVLLSNKLSFKLFYILSISIIFSFLSWLTMTEILSSINFSNNLVPFLYSSKLF